METKDLIGRLEGCLPRCRTTKERELLKRIIQKLKGCRHIKVPVELIGDNSLPVSAQLLFGILLYLADKGEVTITNRILAWLIYPAEGDYTSSPVTGATLIRVLARAGYLEYHTKGIKGGGELKQTKHIILSEKWCKMRK